MELIKKKIQFSLAMLLSSFVTVVFSIAFALTAQQISIAGSIGINYVASLTLIQGSSFNSCIPSACTSIIFDYADDYSTIIENASSEIVVDSKGLGCENGGISSYYDQDNATLYILSNNEIYANPNCTNMFLSKSKIVSIDFHNFNTSNVIGMSSMFEKCTNLTSLDLSGFNTSNVTNMISMFYDCYNLTSIDLSGLDTSNITDVLAMFYNCSSLTSIDLSGLDTSNITRMSYMFYNCSSLTSIDLSSFNTSKVTNMRNMFYNCSSIISIDLSGFNTSIVTNMSDMFNNCINLTSIDLSSFNTSNVTNKSYMFYNCTNLKTIYVSEDWSTDAVKTSGSMFGICNALVGGEGTTFNPSYVDKTYARVDGGPSSPGYFTLSKSATLIDGSTFNSNIPEECTSIIFDYASNYQSIASSLQATPVDVKGAGLNDGGISSYYDQSNKTLYVLSNREIYANPDCSRMFQYKGRIGSITFNNFNTSKVTNMEYMFFWCSVLRDLDLSVFNTSNVENMIAMFIYCHNLETIWVSGDWDISSLTDVEIGMFNFCENLVGGLGTAYNSSCVGPSYAKIDGGPSSPGYFTLSKSATLIDGSTFNSKIPADCTSIIFDYASNYQSIASSLQATPVDVKGSGVNDGGISLYYDSANTTLYVLSNCEIYANPNCSSMFQGQTEILSIAFNNFNTSNVTNMSCMFAVYNTTDEGYIINGKLKNIVGLNKFNTINVTDMSNMFNSRAELTDLDLSSFNTSNVTSMGGMFASCYSLTELDLSGFSTSNVTTMGGMFYSCYSLTELDLSSFHTSKVTAMNQMFHFCIELKTIWVGNYWETSSVGFSDMMFTGCGSLVGGEGTKSSSSYVDKTYARVDGGASNPGYLTLSTPATLMSGSAFNSKIPSDCTEVIFDRYGLYASKFTNWSLGENVSVDASGNTTSEIKIFKEESLGETKLYVLSKGKIYANPDCSSMFLGKTEILSITFNNFNTSNVIYMNSMFAVYYDNGNGYINGKLGKIDGLNKFNTSNVTNMMHMFRGCAGLTSLDLSHFDTSNVTNMAFMFYYCINLKSLNLSSFNTSQVVIMAAMFGSCENLTELDLSSFNTSQVTVMTQMFVFCKNLKTIYVGDAWTTNLLTASSNPMFMECFSLCGGKETVWNSDRIAYDYAKIDGGPSNPGYFTLKQ